MVAKDKAADSLELAKSERSRPAATTTFWRWAKSQFAWQQSAMGRLRRLLKQQEPVGDEPDLRGFEWHYWNRMARGAPSSLTAGGSRKSTPSATPPMASAWSPPIRTAKSTSGTPRRMFREQRLQIADGPLVALAIDPKSRWCPSAANASPL